MPPIQPQNRPFSPLLWLEQHGKEQPREPTHFH